MWRFMSEAKSKIPLPPEQSFAEALDVINPKTNSFYVLENGDNYIQCGGSKERCTVELREYDEDGSFRHFVFYDPTGSDEPAHIPMSGGGVHRQAKHCLQVNQAIGLFENFFQGDDWLDSLACEDITAEF